MNNIDSEVRTCQFYAAGKSETELIAYNEYDSAGSGEYFSDDTSMCERYTYSDARAAAKKKELKVYLVTITKAGEKRKIEIGEM